jgi:hypothetical protein
MVESRDCPRFSPETLEKGGIVRLLGNEHFDRDVPIELGMIRAVHRAHSPGAKALYDLILTQPGMLKLAAQDVFSRPQTRRQAVANA